MKKSMRKALLAAALPIGALLPVTITCQPYRGDYFYPGGYVVEEVVYEDYYYDPWWGYGYWGWWP
jgi:hypothetical protein